MTTRIVYLIPLSGLLFASCTTVQPTNTAAYGSFSRTLDVPQPAAQRGDFVKDRDARPDSLTKGNRLLHGFVTENRKFLDSIVLPALAPQRSVLTHKPPIWALNDLILFTHETYRTWFGPGFYRWGGDILDLDDPQESGSGYTHRYGLDCSGFASASYELAVLLGVLSPDDSSAVFCSAGFSRQAPLHGWTDGGGRYGEPNHFRVDTHDFRFLGREVFHVSRGGTPTDEQVASLQPGDIIWKNGHVGTIVFIDDEPYYLESGGRTLPKNGQYPHRAGPALTEFAARSELVVRRALPDLKASR